MRKLMSEKVDGGTLSLYFYGPDEDWAFRIDLDTRGTQAEMFFDTLNEALESYDVFLAGCMPKPKTEE